MNMKTNKRGFSQVAGVVTTLTLVVILFVVLNIANSQGADIIDDLQDDQTSGGYAYNISGQGLTAQENIGDRTATLATIIMVAAVITVLLVAFAAFFRGR
jgi:hypothetical protein